MFSFSFISSVGTSSAGGGGGCAARLPLFLLFSFPCSADHESGIGHRVKLFFRVGDQYAEYEKQQLRQQQHTSVRHIHDIRRVEQYYIQTYGTCSMSKFSKKYKNKNRVE